MSAKLVGRNLALALKKDFDSSYGPAWHCIVGTSFGSYITHSTGGFLYFSIDKIHDHKAVYKFVEKEAGPPYEALFLILTYLPLFELLTVNQVCNSLRDAVNMDVMSWLNIVVEKPLSLRLSDAILVNLASMANCRLQSLALMNCAKITDKGLLQVVEQNSLITKLYLPGYTGLTPEGLIQDVKTLFEHGHYLKSIIINGIYNIKNNT